MNISKKAPKFNVNQIYGLKALGKQFKEKFNSGKIEHYKF